MSHIKYIPVSPHSDEFLGIEYKLQIHLGTGELSEFHAWTVCNPHVTVNFERNCQVRGLDLMQQAEAETHTRDNGIEDHSHDAGGGGAAGGVRQAHEGERPQQAYAKRRGAGGETVRGCRREGFTHTLHTDTHRHNDTTTPQAPSHALLLLARSPCLALRLYRASRGSARRDERLQGGEGRMWREEA